MRVKNKETGLEYLATEVDGMVYFRIVNGLFHKSLTSKEFWERFEKIDDTIRDDN